jgi:Undecaprenyl-phosphate glucose phosphotransferase
VSIESSIRVQKASEVSEALARSAALSSDAVPYLLPALDAAAIILASVLGGIGYQLSAGYFFPDLRPYLAVGLFASFIHVLRLRGRGYYQVSKSAKPGVEFGEVLLCWCTTGLILAFFAFLLKVGVAYSRGAAVTFYLLAPAALLGVRSVTKSLLRQALLSGVIRQRDVVLVGDAQELAALDREDALFGTTMRFVLDKELRTIGGSLNREVMKAVVAFVRRHNYPQILLALPWSDDRIDFVRDFVKELPVAVRLMPDARVRSLTNHVPTPSKQDLAIDLKRAPLSKAELLVKRAMDLASAGFGMLLLSPVMMLTALAIKLDSSGPAIFRQARNGFNGKQFVIYKFRTMHVQENGDVVTQARPNDTRVTRIGRLLRSTSLDELPQLFNVLKGEMSLIGPRPHALAHDNEFEELLESYAFRQHMKPGLTGWAQCNGSRGATPSIEHIAERVQLDLWYINNWSLWLDVQIIFKTMLAVLQGRNAY